MRLPAPNQAKRRYRQGDRETGGPRPAAMQHLELPELLPDTLPELLPTPAADAPSTRQLAPASCEQRVASGEKQVWRHPLCVSTAADRV